MSSAAPQFEVGAVVLGYVGSVATWRRPVDPKRYSPMLVVQTCSSTDEGAHTPAESVTLTNRAAILALREACDEALKEGGHE